MLVKGTFMMECVLLIRPFLKKFPRNLMCLLWALLALRLICPWNIPISQAVFAEPAVQQVKNSGIWQAETALRLLSPEEENTDWKLMIGMVWGIGSVSVFGYWLWMNRRLKKRVREAVLVKKDRKNVRIWMCDGLETAFVLGIWRPSIYLPDGMRREQQRYVLLHESSHINRKDHIWKWAACLLIALYWFHPLVWICAAAFFKDMEEACDEAVLKELGERQRLPYAQALFEVADRRRNFLPGAVGFGEGDVKKRIMHILQYKKKPAAVLAIATVLILGAFSLFFMEKKESGYGEVEELAETGFVNRETVRIRKGPGEEYETAGLLPCGEQVQISGKTENADGVVWYRIALPDFVEETELSARGYFVRGDLLTRNGQIGP